VDHVEEHELRAWADALCASADSERRAMGKAILMLLGQIETLKGELELAQRPSHDAAESALAAPDELSHSAADASDGTATIRLRERLRAATHRHD
jgi:hypothetical protein